ncbi:MAG: DNA cytosine methyltransferase [Planctomycetes bacterium]|nr:DNA cytosine methyltransferase [Planctomycetota bacterium]
MRNGKPVAIDLFCGAGGLTLGLKRAGFNVALGIELHRGIAETYRANHKKTELLRKCVTDVTGQEIFKLLGKKKIDLVAGCPPCQGFSQLTEKYKRRDSRNGLVLEMARIIEETKPRMVMMENVPGITTKGKLILEEFVGRLKRMGYLINMDVLQMADYGVPQSRKRFVLLAGKGFYIPLPKPTHCSGGDEQKKLKPWVTVSEAIRNMAKPVTLSKAIKKGGPERFNWHVVRDLKPISIERLKAVKEGEDRTALPRRLRPKCHRKSNKGFKNVYGRMRWDEISPTITSGCITPCMGRFGHPRQLRTISIREAALLQTFPVNYRFKTKFTSVVRDSVGNALPCRFAKVVSHQCSEALSSTKNS